MSDDPDARKDFGPFLPGIELVKYNDIHALEELFEKVIVLQRFLSNQFKAKQE